MFTFFLLFVLAVVAFGAYRLYTNNAAVKAAAQAEADALIAKAKTEVNKL